MAILKINFNNYVRFNIDINRRITIINGDSATGKSLLIQVLETIITNKSFYANDVSGFDINSFILIKHPSELFKLQNIKHNFIVVDRYDLFSLNEKEILWEKLKLNGNAWLIMARTGDIPNYGYGMESILELKTREVDGILEIYSVRSTFK